MSSPGDDRFIGERTKMLPDISEEPNYSAQPPAANGSSQFSEVPLSNGTAENGTSIKQPTPTSPGTTITSSQTNNGQKANGHNISREHPFAQSWAGNTKNRASHLKSDRRTNSVKKSDGNKNSTIFRVTQSVDSGLTAAARPKSKLERRRSQARLAGGSYMHVPIERAELASSHRASREASLRSSRRASSRYLSSYQSTVASVRSGDVSPAILQSRQESVSVVPPTAKEPPIDRGWAWVVMVACCFTFFFGDGIAFTFGVLYPELLKEFGEDNKAKVSLVGSVLSGFYLGPGPIASALGDKLGYRITAIVGSIMASLSFLAASFSVNVESLIVLYGVLGGFGFCLMFVSGMVATSLYFEKKRPIALGVASCGSGLGIIVFPFLLRTILTNLSWRWLLRIEAGILLLGILTALTYCPFPQAEEEEKEEIRKPSKKVSFLKQVAMLIDWRLLKSPVFLLIGASAMCSTLGISTPFFFTTDLAMKQGIEDDKSAFLVSIMGITNTAGRVLIGLVAYKVPVSPLLLLAGGQLVGGIATCLSFLYNSYALLAMYAAINGIAYAFDAVLSTEILARSLGRKHLAGAFGLLCLCRGITISITGPIGGILFDKTMTYNATYFLAGACVLLAAVLTVITYVVVRRQGTDEDELNDSQEEEEEAANIHAQTIPEEEEEGGRGVSNA